MAKFETINQLYSLLKNARYPLTKKQLQEKLECSAASVERYLTELRDTYSLEVEYQREYKGYVLAQDPENDIELPSHLFTTDEINAILLIEQIINDLEPGFLEGDTQVVKQHLAKIRQKFSGGEKLESNRIRMINIGKRKGNIKNLGQVTQAVLKNKQITIQYDPRSVTQTTSADRKLSPQRLTHYRDNWYLDAWCHQKEALRTFALERIIKIDVHKSTAKKLSEKQLNDHYTPTFGIFGGQVQNIAVLKFTPHRSQWVAEEVWHHEQKGVWLEDGSYQLEIPYGNDLELIGDILKYGGQVEVVAPTELRCKIVGLIKSMAEQYS